MKNEPKAIDWSDKCWKDMLIYQRKALWPEDTLDKFASWMDIKHGMTAVDVGCGLGYLGYTYWKYFGKGGHYIGVDNNLANLNDAAKAAAEWAVGGKAGFIAGSAYRLPLPDNCVDWAMCQVVLIHLEDPHQALSEMIRISKPGGLIMCKEPDNESSALLQNYNSLPPMDIETRILSNKVFLTCDKGRRKLGHGDAGFGRKAAHTMKLLGLQDIEIRNNDKVHFLEPPYDTPLKKQVVDRLREDVINKERRDKMAARSREQFIAGGGNLEEFDRIMEVHDKRTEILQTQIERGEYFACHGGLFYVIKGRKPEI